MTISGVAGKSAAASVRRQLSALLEIMAMNLIGGAGTGVALDARAFQTGELNLPDNVLAADRSQMEAFLSVI